MDTNFKRQGRIKCYILFAVSMCILFTAKALQKDSHLKLVVIDAGHGGKDPGTVVGSAREKNVVLDIALKLGNLIKQNQTNIKVVYTRDNDYYVPLMDRANIANRLNAELFISIHANYCENPEINGTETYVLGLHRTEDNLKVAKKENSVILLEDDYTKRYEGFNPNLSESYIMFELIQDSYLDQSLRFASILQSNFKKFALRHDREVRQAGFLVLRETAMPSVLIETGYLSNKKENGFLMTDAGRSEIAQSIYGSLVNYLNKLDSKVNNLARTDSELIKMNVVPSQKRIEKNTKEKLPVVPLKSEEKSTRKETITSNNEKIKDIGIQTMDNKPVYAIQIGVYSKEIASDSKVLKGISPVKVLKIEKRYKYFCCVTESLEIAKNEYMKVQKLFPDAFIVEIRNNQTRMVW